MSCDKLLKEAFSGIKLGYKLNTVIDDMPSTTSFNTETIEKYLHKKGVSPKEIKASGILDMYKGDYKFSAAEWKEDFAKLGNKHQVNKLDAGRTQDGGIDYDITTLGEKGHENPTYKEAAFQTKKQQGDPQNVRHYEKFNKGNKSILGWNRTHVDNINGKESTVLNELQSDWAKMERDDIATFQSNSSGRLSPDEAEVIQKQLQTSISEKKAAGLTEEVDKLTQELDNLYKKTLPVINDFPMSEKAFNQLQIVDAIDQSLKNGTNRVVIPIQRENELVGTAGVTKFYENLNKSILPDIRKKLEKQGLKIQGSIEPYGTNNQLHVLDIVEIPNTTVNWNVYSLLVSLGLGSIAKNMQDNQTKERDNETKTN